MPSEQCTFYKIYRGGEYVWIKLIHYTNNEYAAKKAMFAAFGIDSSMVITSTFGTMADQRINASLTFDGRNCH